MGLVQPVVRPVKARPVVDLSHLFVPGDPVDVVAHGRTERRIPCATCGKYANAPRHRVTIRAAQPAKAQTVDVNPRPDGWFSVVDALNLDAPHSFVPGGPVVKRNVRSYPTCAACGANQNAYRHRDPDSRASAEAKRQQTLSTTALTRPKSRPIRPAVDYHAFEPGTDTKVDGRGRTRPLCATCGTVANAPRHRDPEAVAAVGAKAAATMAQRRLDAVAVLDADPRDTADAPDVLANPHPRPDVPRPTRIARDRIVVPTAELASLAIAIDAVLAAPVDAVGWKLRMRLAEVRSLIDLPMFPSMNAIDHVPDVEAPSETMTDAMPALRVVERPTTGTSRSMSIIRGIRNDRMRALARRAIDQGWEPTVTGSNHVALSKGKSRLIVSATAVGSARGWMNLRADAKRVGIDVGGL